ncbi:hypothetical protein V3C41_10110 [Paenarthrobacter nicotinovorans]|uniref:Uncharacterized protein n=1 Tax=Paenarthrobacter nicotinovorans TaxID=29320 RepID=A0ABV0GSD6_PAENI
MSTARLLQYWRRWLGIARDQRRRAPDDGGPGSAVVDPSRGTVHIQLTVMGQPL